MGLSRPVPASSSTHSTRELAIILNVNSLVSYSRQEMISKSAIFPLLLLAAFLLLVISVLNSKRLNSRLLSELEAGQLELRAAVDTGDKCSRSLASKTEQLEQDRREIERMQSEIGRLGQQNTDVRSKVETGKKSLEAEKKEKLNIQQTNAAFQKQINAQNVELEKAKNELKSLQAENEKLIKLAKEAERRKLAEKIIIPQAHRSSETASKANETNDSKNDSERNNFDVEVKTENDSQTDVKNRTENKNYDELKSDQEIKENAQKKSNKENIDPLEDKKTTEENIDQTIEEETVTEDDESFTESFENSHSSSFQSSSPTQSYTNQKSSTA